MFLSTYGLRLPADGTLSRADGAGAAQRKPAWPLELSGLLAVRAATR